jgi:hypothetical protein
MRSAVLALAMFVMAPAAQDRPNFSGRWVATSVEGDASARGFSVGTDRDGGMTITQDANTLTVAWVSFSRAHQPVQAIANLDGSERRFVDRNSVEPQERTTRARWVGARLVITTKWAGSTNPDSAFFQSPIETEETLSLESASTLKLQVTRRQVDRVWTATRTFRRQ